MKDLRFHDHWHDSVARRYKRATRRLRKDSLPPYEAGEIVRVVDNDGPYGRAEILDVYTQRFSEITSNQIAEEGWSQSFGPPHTWFEKIITDIYGPDCIDNDEMFWVIEFNFFNGGKIMTNKKGISKNDTIKYRGAYEYLHVVVEEMGLSWSTVYSRVRRGKSLKEALKPTSEKLQGIWSVDVLNEDMHADEDPTGPKLEVTLEVAEVKGLWAFWEYSEFPFMLGSEISKIGLDGRVYSKDYLRWFKPLFIVPTKTSQLLTEALENLKIGYLSEDEKLKDTFLSKLNGMLESHKLDYKVRVER